MSKFLTINREEDNVLQETRLSSINSVILVKDDREEYPHQILLVCPHDDIEEFYTSEEEAEARYHEILALLEK